MKESIRQAVIDQINAEFQSAYIYLAMSGRMQELRLPGMAGWLRVQWDEERMHAEKLFDFLIERDATVELRALGRPEAHFDNALEAFQRVLEHEQYITERIHQLAQLALEERDYPLQNLMTWFVDEQVEEESSVREIIDSLSLASDSTSALLMIDRELAARKTQPADAGQ